jgi:hypothetical protein
MLGNDNQCCNCNNNKLLTLFHSDPVPPPPDKSVTSPVVKVYVAQQHAFQIGAKKAPAATSTECKLCSVNFANQAQYEAHVTLETHTVKEAFRTNRYIKLSDSHPCLWDVNDGWFINYLMVL